MAIRLEHINKSFGAVPVLHDINLTFNEREFITLVGASGCGKTTLLRIIAGLEQASSGAIFRGDQPVSHLPPGKRDIAMVFQNYALYPHMTVAKNIGYGLRVRGTPADEIRKRVEDVGRVLEIEHLLDRKPKQLSGGQRQRVALGRAMVRKPWLFLMDEPLSNLDAKLRVTMRSELKRFHLKLETTTVYVTHDQLEAMTMSDRIAVMDKGIVQQFGTPEQIYNSPANLFVAGFIGSPPMNFLENVGFRGEALVQANGGAPMVLPVESTQRYHGIPAAADMILGIRPQDVHLDPVPVGGVQGKISLIQLIGSEKMIDIVLANGTQLAAEVKADLPVSVGQAVGVRFDPMKIHLFDTASKKNLLDSKSNEGAAAS